DVGAINGKACHDHPEGLPQRGEGEVAGPGVPLADAVEHVGQHLELGGELMVDGLALGLEEALVEVEALARLASVERPERGLCVRVDEQPGDLAEKVVTGGAVDL